MAAIRGQQASRVGNRIVGQRKRRGLLTDNRLGFELRLWVFFTGIDSSSFVPLSSSPSTTGSDAGSCYKLVDGESPPLCSSIEMGMEGSSMTRSMRREDTSTKAR
ncbi:unnamed protein product [Linum trigynum]|uniref:Uncharacterized protein n=1 Tax=Linum trigynum TaxID=586398 RepID=A0AAV2CLN2_9ROSI